MRNGRVKFFNLKSKFGFITDIQEAKEYYVHAKDLAEEVKEGDLVEFEIVALKRGPVAVNVKKKSKTE